MAEWFFKVAIYKPFQTLKNNDSGIFIDSMPKICQEAFPSNFFPHNKINWLFSEEIQDFFMKFLLFAKWTNCRFLWICSNFQIDLKSRVFQTVLNGNFRGWNSSNIILRHFKRRWKLQRFYFTDTFSSKN